MTLALLRKELRQLLPLAAVLAAMSGLGLVQIFLSQPPDEVTWLELSVLLESSSAPFVTAVCLLVAVVAAYMLYPREHDHGTIRFIYSLPLTPGTVFATKVTAAGALLVGFHTLDSLFTALILHANPSSLSGSQFHWSLWFLEWLLVSLVFLIGLAHGMLLSFFRRFGALLALVVWGAARGLIRLEPSFDYLDPFSLLTIEFRGAEPIVPLKPWVFHGVIALVSFAVSYRLWIEHAEGFTAFNTKASQRTFTRVATVAGVVCALLAVVVTITSQITADSGEAGPDAEGPIDISTTHYRFRYLPADRSGALTLSSVADEGYQAIRTLLGADTAPTIVADLTEESDEHLGIAGWQKMRIERRTLTDPVERTHTLYHETTHVLAATESGRRLVEHGEDGQFFSEGLAEWTSYEILANPPNEDAHWALAATAWQRFGLQFDDLLSSSNFFAEYDEWLIYALGFVWVDALAHTCGEQAPGATLRAMTRTDAPRDLHGRQFWQDTLQSIQCDLSAVNARLSESLHAKRENSSEISQLRGGLSEVSESALVFELTLEPPQPSQTVKVAVKLRDSTNLPGNGITQAWAVIRDGRAALVEIPDSGQSGQPFEYQLGVEFAPGQRMFFDRWRRAFR